MKKRLGRVRKGEVYTREKNFHSGTRQAIKRLFTNAISEQVDVQGLTKLLIEISCQQ